MEHPATPPVDGVPPPAPAEPVPPTPVERQVRTGPVYTPALDIHDTPDGLVLEADLPGVPPDNLQLQVENNVLHILGHVDWPIDSAGRPLHEEFHPASYYRSFILSDEVDVDQIAAEFNDGVLRLLLPRAAKAKPRKIAINTRQTKPTS